MNTNNSLTYSFCKEIALGVMHYSISQFRSMRVGDFLDALGGQIRNEGDRIKKIAELFRMQTAILWNIQVSKENQLSPEVLWPMPWDTEVKGIVIDDKERARVQQLQEELLLKKFSKI